MKIKACIYTAYIYFLFTVHIRLSLLPFKYYVKSIKNYLILLFTVRTSKVLISAFKQPLIRYYSYTLIEMGPLDPGFPLAIALYFLLYEVNKNHPSFNFTRHAVLGITANRPLYNSH